MLHLTLDHEQLLTLVRMADAAAEDDDHERLRDTVLELFDSLVDHVNAGRATVLTLPLVDARILLAGQQHVLHTLVDLAVCAAGDDTRRCRHLTQRLLAQLTVHADGERHRLVGSSSRRRPLHPPQHAERPGRRSE
jgi:hypothetical protein